jgi:prophage regulatory protein
MQSRSIKILRLPEVRARTGLSTSTIYAKIAEGTFPKQVPLGPHSVGFVESEIDDFNAACIAERDTAVLKNLKGEPQTDAERGAVARELVRKVAQSKTASGGGR